MELYYRLPDIQHLYEQSDRLQNQTLEIGFKIASSFMFNNVESSDTLMNTLMNTIPDDATYATTCLYVAHHFVSECLLEGDGYNMNHPHHLEENNELLNLILYFDRYGLYVLRSCGFLRGRKQFVVIVDLTELLVMDENCFTEIIHTLFRKNIYDKGMLTEYWNMLTPLELRNVTAQYQCVSFSKSNINSIYTNLSITYIQLRVNEENNEHLPTDVRNALSERMNREMIEMNINNNENAGELINILDEIQHASFEQDREQTIETLYSKHSEITYIETTVSKFDKEECCVCLSELSEYMCPHCNAKICKECFNELRSRNCECPMCRVTLTEIIQYADENENKHDDKHENGHSDEHDDKHENEHDDECNVNS